MFVRLIEVWLTTQLLRSPTFHKAVRTVHKTIQTARHGKDPSELGGTNIDGPPSKTNSFMRHYVEELKQQFKETVGKK